MSKYSLTYAYLLKKYGIAISWQDAAAETDIYWENIRRMCAKGTIRAEKVGRAWLLTTRALADYIDYGPMAKQEKDKDEKVIEIPQKQKRGAHKYVKPGIKISK